jgi:VIT1/CCC1 family predicted Fe2+/Mn2+ transporter
MRRPDAALETLTREELGLSTTELGSPWVAAVSSFLSFSAGAIIPVIPFFVGSGTAAIVVATVLSAATLGLVGCLIALLAGRSPLRGGVRMLAIASFAGVTSFLIGSLIGAHVNV